jgi:hypothetical protein
MTMRCGLLKGCTLRSIKPEVHVEDAGDAQDLARGVEPGGGGLGRASRRQHQHLALQPRGA